MLDKYHDKVIYNVGCDHVVLVLFLYALKGSNKIMHVPWNLFQLIIIVSLPTFSGNYCIMFVLTKTECFLTSDMCSSSLAPTSPCPSASPSPMAALKTAAATSAVISRILQSSALKSI